MMIQHAAVSAFQRATTLRYLSKILIIVTVSTLVLWLAWSEIHALSWHSIREAAARADFTHLAYALFLTLAAIAAMGMYDAVAFPSGSKHIGLPQRWSVGMFAFAWSNLLSLGGATGPALRLMLYRRLGLSNTEVAQGLGIHYFASAFGLAGWLVAVFCPIPETLSTLQQFAARFVLALTVALLAAFLFAHQLAPLVSRWLDKRFPGIDLTKAKLPLLGLVSFADWTLTFFVFQVIVLAIEPTAGFGQAAPAFFIGVTVGMFSLLPGGLGTADTVWLYLLGRDIGSAQAAAAVVLLRVIFYLAPWALSTVIAYIFASQKTRHLYDWHRRIVATSVAVGAVLLLISSATPAIPARLHWLMKFTPIEVIETSHLISVIAAAVMLYLVRGLLRGYRSAFLMTLGLLTASILSHLLKGADIEESTLAMLLIFMLLLSAQHFDRRGSFNLGWELLLAVFAGMFSLFLFTGFTAFENIPYHPGLWTRVAPNADPSRFLRALPALLAVALFFTAREAMKPKSGKVYPSPAELDRAEYLIRKYANSADPFLIGGGDKAVWFWSPDSVERGLVLYQRTGDSLVVYKDPVIDPSATRADLIRGFLQFANRADLDVVFSMISIEWMDILHDFGFHFIKFTQEAIIDLNRFSLKGGHNSSMRYTLHNCEKNGIRFAVLTPPHSKHVIEQCRQTSDAWLAIKGDKEMQFSACYFSEPYLQRHPLGVATDESGEIVAFINVLITRENGAATFDFMRYRPNIINSLMDYVILKTALYCQAIGCSSLSLGGAALSNVGHERGGPWLERLLQLVLSKAETLYNYQGIYRYKNKFAPDWVPRYLAYRLPYDWGSALYTNMQAVRPSRADRKRIETARTAETYPFEE